ncbi:abortive phage infection protein [Paracnuella aquatica]|nr:abortive phage infection protein [Paracnuella aquatica]
MPSLNDAKLIETEECNDSFCTAEDGQLKINGYTVNESGERLQIFIVNEDSIDIAADESKLLITQKAYYEKQFARAFRFVNKAFKKYLDDEIQDSSPSKALISFLASSAGAEQIDVVEIFLLSATATVETRSGEPTPKRIDFDDEAIKVSYSKERKSIPKDITVIKRLIDLNFLYNVIISQGNREALEIHFDEPPFNYVIESIQAADEDNFESYLCVLPATVLFELYKRYSSRMLEKNVRSFLQFKGVNAGIKDTIRRSPEKFLAYNNGLTITATGKETVEQDGKVYIKYLKDFQIVNGGQTTATIYFSKKDGLDVSKVRVMAKINVAKDSTEEELEDLISNISTFSNAQNKVSKVDLRSRNPQLLKLKSLSDSVVTPGGRKWFFERAKGEFNTLIRKSPKDRSKIEKEYPKERRFSKEELAKYFIAWGDQPYLVKKGGEKVFRDFIECLSADEKGKKGPEIDRGFYEELISKIILFRSLEKIYGSGKYSFGNLRAAVVPYSISVLYSYANGSKEGIVFDLGKLWLNEGLADDLSKFFSDLMKLMNELIKKYAASDDYNEYSKKAELWDRIIDSKEICAFMEGNNARSIIKKYSLSREEMKKRAKKKSENTEVDFVPLYGSARIYANTYKFYEAAAAIYSDKLTKAEKLKLSEIMSAIQNTEPISLSQQQFESEFIHRIRKETPEFFDNITFQENRSFVQTVDFIVNKYNQAVANGRNIKSEFSLIKELATRKGAKYAAVFDQIGDALKKGSIPTMKHLAHAWNYVQLIDKRNLEKV